MDFSTSSWFSKLESGMTVLRVVDGFEFRITGNASAADINGYGMTPKDWESALAGEQVTLAADGKVGFLTSSDNQLKVSLGGSNKIILLNYILFHFKGCKYLGCD